MSSYDYEPYETDPITCKQLLSIIAVAGLTLGACILASSWQEVLKGVLKAANII